MKIKTLHAFLIAIWAAVFIWSGINPAERFTWFLEVAPSVIGFAVLAATYRKFKLTDLTYAFICFFCIIQMIGGKYTYAEVPVGNYFKEAFDLSRNHYDRLGHFLQGFVPALIAREILLRISGVKGKKMLFFLCVCIAMFVSSSYEIIEWMTAELTADGAADFLGLQGDIWDAQKDMLMALAGSVFACMFFSRLQDRQIKKLSGKK
jgi:putative membrane protein